MLKQMGEEGFIHLFDKYLSDSYYMSQALFAGQWEVTLPLPLSGRIPQPVSTAQC